MLRFKSQLVCVYPLLLRIFILALSAAMGVLIGVPQKFIKKHGGHSVTLPKNSKILCKQSNQSLQNKVLDNGTPAKRKNKEIVKAPRLLAINQRARYLINQKALLIPPPPRAKRPAVNFKTTIKAAILKKRKVPARSRRRKRRTIRIRRRCVRKIAAPNLATRDVSTQDSQSSISNETVKQLKEKLHFIWPLSKSNFWMSSPFGPRKNPNGSYGFHTGVDLAAVRGTPVKAVTAAKVLQAGYYKGYGNMVLLQHEHGVKTRYAHLSKINVRVGQLIAKGKIVGNVGNTGHVRKRKGRDGSHLHLEVYVGAKREDPLRFLEKQ